MGTPSYLDRQVLGGGFSYERMLQAWTHGNITNTEFALLLQLHTLNREAR